MAKSNGIVGGITGRVGNVVGYYRRGKFLMRAYNPHTTNVRSKLQVIQRARMKENMQLLKGALSVLRKGFQYTHPGYQLVNGVKLSMPAFEVVEGAMTVDMTKIQLSKPQFEVGATLGTLSFATAGQIGLNVTMPETGFVEELPADYRNAENVKVMVAACCPEEKGWVSKEIAESGEATLVTPAKWAGKEVHVYSFVEVEPDRILGEGGLPCMVGQTEYAGNGTMAE